jgi:hypothetical protein
MDDAVRQVQPAAAGAAVGRRDLEGERRRHAATIMRGDRPLSDRPKATS